MAFAGLAENHRSQARAFAAIASPSVFSKSLLEADLFLPRDGEWGWASLLSHIQHGTEGRGDEHRKFATVIQDEILPPVVKIVSDLTGCFRQIHD